MPPKRRRNRNRKAPNVFVQEQRERDEIEAARVSVEASADAQVAAPDTAAVVDPVARAARPRASRMTQTTRSDVYAVTIPSELRKMGVLAAGVVVVLVVFSFVLG